MIEILLLALILIANGAPVIARKVFGAHFNQPLDFNKNFIDDKPLLGSSKTILGVIVSIITASLCAWLLALPVLYGFLIGLCAMLGDLISSFIKRRCGLAPSSQAFGLDQIPESLLPMLVAKYLFDLTWINTIAVVLAFVVCGLVISRILYFFNIKNSPY